jgi:hypothetical protein
MLMKRLLLTALSCLLTGTFAAQPNTDWTPLNLAMTDTHVIPGYAAFAEAAAALHAEADDFCARVDAATLAALRTRFHAAMDAWQAVQHLQFGPITYFNWNYRIQYWPDDGGTASRQLAALIAGQDPAVLDLEAFARQSIGVQGFQALEIQLFDADSLAALQTDPYRCAVVRAITANLDDIAGGVAQRWTEEFRTTVANADERGFFESAEDATIDYLKALVESVRRLQQQKLQAVLGDTPAAARERRAESWRSARSLRNLKINLQSLEHLFTGSEPALHTVLHAEDVVPIAEAFAKVQAPLAAQPDSLAAALATEGGHAALLRIAAELDALFEAMEAALKNTDLYLGFNSLDGD